MKEIWRASHDPNDWRDWPVPALLPLWWTFWLVSLPLSRLDVRLWLGLDENSGIDDFIAANIAAQAAAVWEIPLALVLLAIMNRIYRMQVEHRMAPRASASGENCPNPQTES